MAYSTAIWVQLKKSSSIVPSYVGPWFAPVLQPIITGMTTGFCVQPLALTPVSAPDS